MTQSEGSMQTAPVKELATRVVPPVPAEPASMWQRIQLMLQRFNLDDLNEGLGGRTGMVRVGMWFGAGFAIGFLFKRYFRAALATVLLSLLLIKGLEHQHILLINWGMLKQMVGMHAEAGWHNFAQSFGSFVQHNLATLIAGLGGFLFGHHLGG